MKTIGHYLAAVALSMLTVSPALACGQVYYRPKYVAPYVAPVAVVKEIVIVPTFSIAFQPVPAYVYQPPPVIVPPTVVTTPPPQVTIVPPSINVTPPTVVPGAVLPGASAPPAARPGAISPPPLDEPRGAAPKAKLNGLAVMVSRCAVCHDEKTAEKDGGGHAYFKDGALIEAMTDRLENLMIRAIASSRMPPPNAARGGRLSDSEASAIFDALPALHAKKE